MSRFRVDLRDIRRRRHPAEPTSGKFSGHGTGWPEASVTALVSRRPAHAIMRAALDRTSRRSTEQTVRRIEPSLAYVPTGQTSTQDRLVRDRAGGGRGPPGRGALPGAGRRLVRRRRQRPGRGAVGRRDGKPAHGTRRRAGSAPDAHRTLPRFACRPLGRPRGGDHGAAGQGHRLDGRRPGRAGAAKKPGLPRGSGARLPRAARRTAHEGHRAAEPAPGGRQGVSPCRPVVGCTHCQDRPAAVVQPLPT